MSEWMSVCVWERKREREMVTNEKDRHIHDCKSNFTVFTKISINYEWIMFWLSCGMKKGKE